jgi:MFS family permease
MTESSLATAPTETHEVNEHPRRLRWTLGLAAVGVFVALSGVPAVLAALQLSNLDPANKQANLGIIAALGALTGLISTPIWGTISDRARSRFGRRAPVIVAGSAIVVIALIVMGTAPTVPALGVGLCLLQLGFAAVQAPLAATIPDRVPHAARGVASSILGFGIMLGALIGQVIGASLAPVSVPLAYGVGGAIYLVTIAIFLRANRDESSLHHVHEPVSGLAFVRSLWVNPRKHPDFAWAFWGRAFMFLGYGAITTYGFFILEDYIGLTQKETLATIPIMALCSFVGIGISIVISGKLSDRIGRRKPFVIASSIIAGLAAAIPIVSPTLQGVLTYSVISGLGYGCYLAVDYALITQVLPSSANAAKDLGVAAIGSGGAEVLAPAVAAAIVVGFGSYPPLFVIAIVVSFLGAAFTLPIKGVR